MIGQCPSQAALERAFPASAGEELARHVASCAQCGEEWARMEELASLVRELPVAPMSADRADAVRDAVLAKAASRPPSRHSSPFRSTWARAAVAIAASLFAVVLFLKVRPGDPPPAPRPFRASVVAGASARFTHGALPDETIRLVEGTVSLDVEHLKEGERLRVIVGDAEVEVRGTSFVVEAIGDRLSWVHVLKGLVEVRVEGHAPVLLGALEHWRPEPPAAMLVEPPIPVPASPALAPKPRATSAIAAVAMPPIPLPKDLEAPYRAAWDAFRRGDLDAAASGFASVSQENPAGPLASDAAYWRAIALGRAGRNTEAAAALREYLRQFPEAPQAGEAAAMLGWLLLDAADLDGATRAFDLAIRSGTEAAVTSAADGLKAVEQQRSAL